MNVTQAAPPRGRRAYTRGRSIPNAQRVTNIFPKYRKWYPARINTDCGRRIQFAQYISTKFIEYIYLRDKILIYNSKIKKELSLHNRELVRSTFNNEFVRSKSTIAAIFGDFWPFLLMKQFLRFCLAPFSNVEFNSGFPSVPTSSGAANSKTPRYNRRENYISTSSYLPSTSRCSIG